MGAPRRLVRSKAIAAAMGADSYTHGGRPEQLAVKENPLLGEQSLGECSSEHRLSQRYSTSATKARRAESKARLPTLTSSNVAIGSERMRTIRVDPGAVLDAGLIRAAAVGKVGARGVVEPECMCRPGRPRLAR